ncbi:hypothetical protein [Hungatella hathewayi]|uniref:hypothetical protein n=1 Tax=Hungatella hathewayi TaxID=154046 RepID=UPI00110B7B83|nr:hypothetical protein [Hungatella hathewayi]
MRAERKKHNRKRWALSLLLAVLIMPGIKPFTAAAEENQAEETTLESITEPVTETDQTEGLDSEAIKEEDHSTQENTETPQTEAGSVTATVGGISRTVSLKVAPREVVTYADYADWSAVGAAQTEAGLKSSGALAGSGTAEDPWKIGKPEALAWFASKVNAGEMAAGNQNILLTADINLCGDGFGGSVDAPLNWIAITQLSGTFDGGNHTIDYLRGNQALINVVANGTIQNVTIGANGILSGSKCAGIAVAPSGTVIITNCINRANITGSFRAGGIIASGEVGNTQVFISKCGNEGTITITGGIGSGIVGYFSSASMVYYAGIITDCYNKGSIVNRSGDLAGCGGISNAFGEDRQRISNCYNVGSMSGNRLAAIVPGGRGMTSNCFSRSGNGGGLRNGVTALTQTQLQSWAAAYALNGQSMDGSWTYTEGGYPTWGELDRPNDWSVVGQGVIDGLITSPAMPSGDGSVDTPFQIGSAEHLGVLAAKVNTGSPSLNADLLMDINLTGERYKGSTDNPIRWKPIGTSSSVYSGTFNGNGKAIGYMSVVEDGYAGLFGCAGSGAVIKGLGLYTTCSVTASGTTGGNGAAGFVGTVKSDGATDKQITIQNCYNRASITGKTGMTGAFIGNYEGTAGSGTQQISNCYTTGRITTSSGTPGAIAGAFTNGSGGGIKYCYWNKDTSSSSNLNAVGSGAQTTVEDSRAMTTTEMNTAAADGTGGLLENLNKGLGGNGWERSAMRNDGYPIFTVSQIAVNWGDVGAAVMAPLCQDMTSSGTAGQAANPYVIWTAEDLAWFAYQVNNGKPGLCAELKTDINLFGGLYSGFAYNTGDPDIINKALQWIPVGSDEDGKRYTGTFNGNGYTITAMLAKGTEKQGLFGTLGDNAAIRKTSISDCQIETTKGYSGGIAGYVNGKGVEIIECGNKGTLKGTFSGAGMYFGGCVGGADIASETILDGCYNVGNISAPGGNGVGGILGAQLSGGGTAGHAVIRNCMNRGNVEGNIMIGGIVGAATSGTVTITGCYNAGAVSASGGYAGSIEGNYSTAADADITDCLIEAEHVYGGISSNSQVVKSEAFGTWGAAWRLNGSSFKQSTDLSWTYDKTSPYPVLSATGLPPAENWEPVGEALEYGVLKDMEKPTGNGNTTPYQIQTAEQLAWFAWKVNVEKISSSNQNIKLAKDINLFGEKYTGYTGEKNLANIENALKWSPIGNYSYPYQGTFHGGKTEIDGMYLNGDSYLGLIGVAQYPAKVTELGIGVDSKVICKDNFGALLMGAVIPTSNPVEITNCYNLGTIVNEGSDVLVAAFVGDDIRGTRNSAILSNCYNAGDTVAFANLSVGTIDNCYADTTLNPNNGTHEKGDGSGVTSLTTDEMKTSEMAAFLNTYNGTLKTGADRVWYTSLDTEKTKGYPTFKAPTTIAVEFAQDTPEGGSSVTLKDSGSNSVTITDMKLRSFGPADSTFTPGTTGDAGNAFDQTTYTDVTGSDSNYHKYGYTNANANLAFKAGGTDLKGLSQSLNNPVTGLGNVSSVSLGRAAAYTKPEDRYVLLEGASGTDRYEIQMTVKGSVGKTLSVMMPVRVTMAQLTPDGTDHKDYSVDLNITNKNAYPIDGKILKAESKKESGYAVLTPVKASIALSNTGMLAADTGGVRLGLANLAGKSGPLSGEKYYDRDAAAGGTSWMEYRLKYGGVLPYRYFMEYSGIHVAETKQFEYEIGYWFGVSESDYTDTADAVVVR